MGMTPEAKVKKQIRAILERVGAYYSMPIGSGFGNAGTPDFLVCHRGLFIGIEAKAGRGKPTALQEHNLNRIMQAGGEALIVNEKNIDQLEGVLNGIR